MPRTKSAAEQDLGDLYAESGQTLQGSFSAAAAALVLGGGGGGGIEAKFCK